MGLAVVLVPYVSGKVTVCPAIGVAGDGAPMLIVFVALTTTVTFDVCAAVVVVPDVVGKPAEADTVVVRFVKSVVAARPVKSVVTTVWLSEPAPDDPVDVSMANVTGTPPSGLPVESLTSAVIVDVPPADGNVAGLAFTEMPPTAAAP